MSMDMSERVFGKWRRDAMGREESARRMGTVERRKTNRIIMRGAYVLPLLNNGRIFRRRCRETDGGEIKSDVKGDWGDVMSSFE